MRLRKSNVVECDCGDIDLEAGTTKIVNNIEHGPNGCYYLEKQVREPPPAREGKPRMIFSTYVRKPFIVEAVEVTADNIAEIAKFVGDLREEEDGSRYILVDPRLVPNVERVYPGYFMTKMGKNVRCYAKRIFRDQFIAQTDQIKPWVDYMMTGEVPAAS